MNYFLLCALIVLAGYPMRKEAKENPLCHSYRTSSAAGKATQANKIDSSHGDVNYEAKGSFTVPLKYVGK